MRLLPTVALLFAVAGCRDTAESISEGCPGADSNGHVSIEEGLSATILKKGYGRAAAIGDTATVNATLWLHDPKAEDGKGLLIWESGAEPFTFRLGESGLIKGWNRGIRCMLLGERRELIIASQLAYGRQGRPPVPPNADLIYDLELTGLTESGQ